MKIFIATQFTRKPGPRYRRQGSFSAEEFRESLLAPKLRQCIERDEKLEIVFDGIRGVGVSFLEESFGGLIRNGFTYNQIDKHLILKWTLNPEKLKTIEKYIKDATNK